MIVRMMNMTTRMTMMTVVKRYYILMTMILKIIMIVAITNNY